MRLKDLMETMKNKETDYEYEGIGICDNCGKKAKLYNTFDMKNPGPNPMDGPHSQKLCSKCRAKVKK
jgi:hypothetical protein